MKLIINIISWLASQSVLALICYILYNYTLIDLTNLGINYSQWLAIIVIATCVFPEGNTLNTKSNTSVPKIESFINSIIKKHER